MHGGMPRKSLQLSTHVNEIMDLLVLLIELTHFRILFKGKLQRDIQLLRHHLGNLIHEIIGHIHYAAHVADHTPRRQRTEGHDLYNLFRAVFPAHVIDDLLPSLKAKVNIDIRHGHTLRIQKTLKEQLIPDWIDVGDLQAIGDDAARRRTTPRSNRYVVFLRIIDEIPDDQEIIHVSHPPNDAKLIFQPLTQSLVRVPGGSALHLLKQFLISDGILRKHNRLPGILHMQQIPPISIDQTVLAQFIQISPGVISLWHFIVWQLRLSKFNLHGTAVRDPLRIFHGLPCIWKESLHLFLTLYVILSAFVSQAVRIRKSLGSLKAEQNIMGLGILRVGIMNVIGSHQRDVQLPAHAEQLRIDGFLLRYAMILQFQKVIPLAKAGLILPRDLTCLVIQALLQITRHLTGKTRRKGNDSLMIALQHFKIHPRLIIITFRKTFADNFC